MGKLLREHDQTIRTVFSFLGVDPMVNIPQETVFSNEIDKERYPFSRLILKLCYLLEYKRVRRYIKAF